MLEARLESGELQCTTSRMKIVIARSHRGLTTPLPSTPFPTVTRSSMPPTPAVWPTLKAMPRPLLSCAPARTSRTTPTDAVTSHRPASARRGHPGSPRGPARDHASAAPLNCARGPLPTVARCSGGFKGTASTQPGPSRSTREARRSRRQRRSLAIRPRVGYSRPVKAREKDQ